MFFLRTFLSFSINFRKFAIQAIFFATTGHLEILELFDILWFFDTNPDNSAFHDIHAFFETK